MRATVSKGRWRAGEGCKPAAVILLATVPALAQLLPAAAAPASQPVAH